MRTLTKVLLGLGATAAAGYAGFVAQEKRIEKPRYRRAWHEGRFEVRDYEPYVVAETTESGTRQDALERAFMRLADYIFAKQRGGATITPDREKIAMTAPVMQDRDEDGAWRVRFVMPAEHSMATLPPPPAGVTLEEQPGRRVAAIEFSGGQDDARLATEEGELRRWLAKQGITADAPAEYAFYNSPAVLPILRRNEVLIPLPDGV